MASVFTILGQFYDNKANLKNERRKTTEPNIETQNTIRYRTYKKMDPDGDAFCALNYQHDIGFLAKDMRLYDVAFSETVLNTPEWIAAEDNICAAWGTYMQAKKELLADTVNQLKMQKNGLIAKGLAFCEGAKELFAQTINPYIADGKKQTRIPKAE